MSTVFTPYPLVAALVKCEDFLGPQRQWRSVDEKQTRFLHEFFAFCREEVQDIPEIESVGSYSAEVINAFLRQRRFSIQLTPFPPGDFGTASVLDLNVTWLQAGARSRVRTADRKTFPGIYLKGRGVELLQLVNHPSYLVKLTTKSEDVVYLTPLDEAPSEFDLSATIQKLRAQKLRRDQRSYHKGIIFPMVNLDMEIDTQWLLGLNTQGDDGLMAIISQALQQHKFKMNEFGARVKSAAAISVTRGGPIPYVINRPFLIWIERPSLSHPLFAGYITPEHWEDPGDLTDM
ncbi:MAG: hypothetical protein ACPGWR_26870 [Ardenticatenaceae bacterium]